jgi:hypothetical protein
MAIAVGAHPVGDADLDGPLKIAHGVGSYNVMTSSVDGGVQVESRPRLSVLFHDAIQ